MVDQTEYEAAHTAGQAVKLVTAKINGIEHVLVPPNCSLNSMAALMPAPQRIKAHPSFSDVAGFAEYIEEFKEDGSRIFVDDSRHSFTTIFDCHHKGSPAWGDHSASLSLEHSHEWNNFLANNDQKMSPYDFAEFLEDNIAYVDQDATGLTGADLLTMAQTFKVKLKGDLQVEETLQRGMRKLLIQDDSTLKANNSQGNEIEFPETMSFNLRIFKNQSAYPIKVYLRTRTTKDQVIFWIKIPDTPGLIEEAFNHVITEVAETTELPTLKGSFDGPNHRGR